MAHDRVNTDAVQDVLEKIGLELAFVEPRVGARTETLPGLVDELAALLHGDAPAAVTSAVRTARDWCGPAGAGPVAVEPALVERLTAWHAWMIEALAAWKRGLPIPAAETWDRPAAAAPSGPAVVDRAATTWAAGDCQAVDVLGDGADAELMRLFCAESEDLLRDIEQGVLVLERDPTAADTLATVFRAFHTLKGNTAAMRFVVLQRLAHEVESLLDAARQGERVPDRDTIDAILAAADVFQQFIGEMARQLDGKDRGRRIDLPVPGVIARVRAVLATPAPAPAAASPLPPASPPPPASPAPAGPAPVTPERPSVAPRAAAAPGPPTMPPAEPPASRPAPAAAAAPAASVRVDTAKLDGLVDLVGELVIAQSQVLQGGTLAHDADEHLARALGQLRGITAELQRTTMALRMVPIRGTFQKMSRLVRDIAVQLGKEIRLEVAGEETELDRTVVEEIGDPLVHMIRNAADHGIEMPDARVAAGKPRAGTIRLRACHQGGFVVVRIEDDGRGLDAARIRAKAVDRGLVAADAVLDEADTLGLIFEPGFSTAAGVSDLSGRGVGLDVVRRNIDRVRGRIEVESRPGAGTAFTIYMPLTLAIIEGLLVAVGDQRYVIPALAVRESFRPEPGRVTTVHGRGEVVAVRGRLVPLLRLGRHFGIPDAVGDPCRGIVVVVEAGQDCRCLLVDDLVGKQEVVIKSLGETFAERRGFAGGAILGDGRVGLILDTAALVRLRQHSVETAA